MSAQILRFPRSAPRSRQRGHFSIPGWFIWLVYGLAGLVALALVAAIVALIWALLGWLGLIE